jgi:hypothetical protein
LSCYDTGRLGVWSAQVFIFVDISAKPVIWLLKYNASI